MADILQRAAGVPDPATQERTQAPRCARCAGGADPDRVLATQGVCACGHAGALYRVAEPTAAAMRATVALFGVPNPAFDREWLAKRAAVIDHETGLPDLLVSIRKTLAAAVELHAQGIGCPDCPPDAEDTGADCPMLVAAEAAIAKAEARP